MADRLQGTVALVTGAARGIGRAVCAAFAREGADVVGLDLCARASAVQQYAIPTPADLDETGRLVAGHGRRWTAVHADIRDLPHLRTIADEVRAAHGRLDVLACVAAIQAFRPLLEMDDEDWTAQIDVYLTGTANTLRAFAPLVVDTAARRGGGRIILTSSTQGRHGMRDGSAYAASKWGLLGLMKSAALELGAKHVTVNAVVPGLIDTPLTRNDARYRQALAEANAGAVPEGPLEEHAAAALARKTPLGMPWLPPEAVAEAYVFLASDAAALVSGAAYDVTGGDSAHYP